MSVDPSRFPVAVEPALRVRTQRRGARVLLIDDDDRLLLFQGLDPLTPGATWWITPGGGIDPGESEVEAAVREVAEETGLIITAEQLLGPIGRQVVVHGFPDIVVEQDEIFFLTRVSAFEVSTVGHTEEEQLTMLHHRWWTREELATTTEWIWPAQLAQMWDLQGQPAKWPLELGHQEQSTVPA